jgi:hypothetical protein
MVKYNESIIYKICCRNVEIKSQYIGSTTNFNRRKQQHKSRCITENNKSYVYHFIRNNGGWANFDMVEVEKCNVNDKHELHKRERYWIETLNSELNGQIPTQTQKEYNQKVIKCECGSETTKGNISHHKKTQKHIKYLASILAE